MPWVVSFISITQNFRICGKDQRFWYFYLKFWYFYYYHTIMLVVFALCLDLCELKMNNKVLDMITGSNTRHWKQHISQKTCIRETLYWVNTSTPTVAHLDACEHLVWSAVVLQWSVFEWWMGLSRAHKLYIVTDGLQLVLLDLQSDLDGRFYLIKMQLGAYIISQQYSFRNTEQCRKEIKQTAAYLDHVLPGAVGTSQHGAHSYRPCFNHITSHRASALCTN